MGEEWATRSTTVRYGRRRPGWLLDHHLLDRPGKTLDGRRCALAPIEFSSGHGRVLTHRLSPCARRPWIGTSSSPPLDIFDGTSRGSFLCVGVRAAVARFASRRANKAQERIVPRRRVA